MLPETEKGQKLPYDWLEAPDVWWLLTPAPLGDLAMDLTTTITAQPSAKTPGPAAPLLQPAPCPPQMSLFSVPWELVWHYVQNLVFGKDESYTQVKPVISC